jgi:hypothetical protein
MEKQYDKSPTKTNFGPEESLEQIQYQKTIADKNKNKFKDDIIDQMIVLYIQKKRTEIIENKTKEMRIEEANTVALVKDWEETEIKNHLKSQAAK